MDRPRHEMYEGTSEKAGMAPGSLVHVGERRQEDCLITVIDYTADEVIEREVDSVEECFDFRDKDSVTWINIDGLHDVSVIQDIGDGFGLHPLLLEDILNTEQRPKIDDYDDYLFVVVKMISYDEEETEVVTEHVSLVLADKFVISFQETVGDVFDPVRDRVRNGKGRIRGQDVDYLLYALLDAVVDNYFVVLEKVGSEIESLEDGLVEDPDPGMLRKVHELKSEMVYLRRSVWPLREVVSRLEHQYPELIAEDTQIYFRDVYDHTIQVMDSIQSYRDVLTSMVEVYLSSVSNKTNEVMKVLTIMATIFIPLTFVAGVYGMNFEFMPELRVWWAYPTVLGAMSLVAILMLGYFRRRGWLEF
ncbi:MAG: magnesium/cobalt transporter CorA [Halobacteriales archaeon]|nr:magnesium/cobalt transporter CorA [Halobacteriales archaeon]